MGQAICVGVARWRSLSAQHLVAQKLYEVKDMDFASCNVPVMSVRIFVTITRSTIAVTQCSTKTTPSSNLHPPSLEDFWTANSPARSAKFC